MSWRASAERENILCLNIIKGCFKSDWGLEEDADRGFLGGCFQRLTAWFEQTSDSFLLIRYQGEAPNRQGKMAEET